jgi:hypothetical protein
VDGDKVTVKSSDGKSFEIAIAAGRKHRLEVKREGLKIYGDEIEVEMGDRKKVSISLDRDNLSGQTGGFVSIFNGKDLTGWVVDSGDPNYFDS